MDFIDDEAEVSTDDEVLVPSTPTNDDPRPPKRRRTTHNLDESEEDQSEYDLPSDPSHRGSGDDDHDTETSKSKYGGRIHIPGHTEHPDPTFVTQLTQQWSSPARIRGPRWMKPAENTPPGLPHADRALPEASFHPVLLESDDRHDEFQEDEEYMALLEAVDAGENDAWKDDEALPGRDPTASRASSVRSPLQRVSSFRQTTLHGIHTTEREPRLTQSQAKARNWPLANRQEPPTHHEIDQDAMQTWIYPTNLGTKIRDYQYNIVHKGLFHNLLVALPTGLGKTFIAATVMLNWFRWTTKAQIVFMAPTKPLVSQQIDACLNTAGIPRSQSTVLTGEVAPAVRGEEWEEKRIFFTTPQTWLNDLKRGLCDPKRTVLVVVDEAHRATGNYAYVEVIRFLRRFNSSFRVLGLTATPGARVESVQEVIDGLGIARVEIRTEDSLDIREFVHSRNIEIEVLDNSDEIDMALGLFAAALQPLMNKLTSQNAYWNRDPTKITLFGLKQAMDQWKASQAGRSALPPVKGMVMGVFSALMSMAHNLELLKFHGIGPFYHKMKVYVDEKGGHGKFAKMLVENENCKRLMIRLRSWINNPDFVGHPKLSYLKRVALNHFMDAGNGRGPATAATDTRIMIFAHYRDSAEEIVRVLNRHQPMIRAHVFVGQSGTKGSEGMDQKTQLDVIKKFKAGTFNTIVATSIGEEGLDIGEVDLIVCYDCSKSPIRMLQRMGRTGRKRAGNIVLLLMRGKEQDDFRQAKDNYQKIQDKIESGREFTFREDESPRIVPKSIQPSALVTRVEIPVENTQPGSMEPRRRPAKKRKAPPKKFHMPDGVETGFNFLGKGKTSRDTEPQGKANIRPHEEIAKRPPVGDVLLSPAEEEQLERRFMQVAGTEDQVTQHVRMGAFPEHQRRLGTTHAIKHSTATANLVKAFASMRDSARDWTRPTEDVATDFGGGDIDFPVGLGTSDEHLSPSPASQPRPRTVLPARRFSQDNDIDDIDEEEEEEEEEGDEFPDLEVIMKQSRQAEAVAQNGKRLKRSRRILESDDDD